MTRITVEDCLALDTAYLKKGKLLHPHTTGYLQWSVLMHKITARVEIEGLNGTNARMNILSSELRLSQTIELSSSECHYSGKRWWFICPGCLMPKRKIYLPPGYSELACRGCYDLIYTLQITHGSSFHKEYSHLSKLKKAHELQTKLKRKFYRDKPTKIFNKFLKLYSQLRKI